GNGPLDVHVGVHRAFGLQVAQRREAVLEREPRVARAEDGAVGDRLVQELLVVRLRRGIALEQQMGVGVDEAREHGELREVDHPSGARLPRHLSQRSHGLDPLALDDDADVALCGVGAPVDESACLDEHRRREGGGPGRVRRAQPFLEQLERFLRDQVDSDKIDREGEIPDTVIQGLRALGAFGIKIPREYGGLGLSQLSYMKAIELVSSVDGSVTALLSAHQSIGVPQPLKMFGSDAQKKKYFPRLAKGAISAFALTEPGVGSDPAAMETLAVPSEDGQAWILNGEKLWCTNGTKAELM